MVSLLWEDRYNTGIEIIDAQHKNVFEYMTRIYNRLVDDQQSCINVNSKLDQLAIICKLHFIEEENLMDEMSYPSASEHKHLHDMFLAGIDRVKIANKQYHTPSELSDFIGLRDNFISHILVETQEISAFIQDKPLQSPASTVLT